MADPILSPDVPLADDAPPASPDAPSSASLDLTADQLAAAGLGDCQPGDLYVLRASGDSPAGGKSFEVLSVESSAEEAAPDAPHESAPADDLGDDQSTVDTMGFPMPKRKPGFPVDVKKLQRG
jgi:hypothetical protein